MKKLILALSIIGLSAAASYAQELDMVKVDTDGNGLVSLEEANAMGWAWNAEQFAGADKDGDGSLNAEEFSAATQG